MSRDADHQRHRHDMVEHDLRARGVHDAEVLRAMRTVPRERFVPEALAGSAYADRALPIEWGQTISQPLIVAMMTEAARVSPTDRVLEVGAGSGYGAAVLRELGASVVTIERHGGLAASAVEALAAAGYVDVDVVVGDGTLGWPAGAPYDAIIVTAAGPEAPAALLEQLGDGGRLVIPEGRRTQAQQLVRYVRRGETFERHELGGVRFVPLIGEQGFDP